MALKERLIQLTLKARDMFSGQVEKSSSAVEELTDKAKELKEQLADTARARGLARTLRDNEQAAGGLERAMQDAQGNLADLTREIEKSETVTAGQSIALREAKRAVDESTRAYERNQRAITNVRSELKALGVNVEADMTEAEQQLTAKLEENKRALDENREAIKRKREEEKAAADAANAHASRVSAAREAMSGGMRTVLGFAAAYVSLDAAIGLASRAVDAIRAGIGNMLSAGDNAEALQSRMTSLMGSIAAGEQATKWIGEFAKQTPLATAEVADAFMLLKSYGLDPMDGTLKSLVDKNEQLGGGMDRLTGIVTALGQAQAKSKLQTEEILQLVERGVPAWDMLSKITGKNAADLEELASKGRLGRDVIKALIAELGKSADGDAATGMSRLSGLMSQLSDIATDFYKRIANAGALDYAKGKLQQLINTIGQMDKDGRLDKLAKSLSDAFIQGAEKAENFAKRLAGVDFNKLIDNSATWLSDFGTKVDEAATRVQLFIAPFRSLFNGITSGVSMAGTYITGFAGLVLGAVEQIAKAVPDMVGGEKLRASVASARGMLNAMRDGFVEQIEQDGQDIRSAWDTTNNHMTASTEKAVAEQTEAHKSALEQQRMLDQAYADHLVANQQKAKDAAIAAATEGTAALGSMAEALQLIDTSRTTTQLDGLRAALLKAYQDGKISLEQYQQATGVLNAKLTEIGKSAAGAGDGVSDLSDKLGDLAAVQAAISAAKTDVDINAIKKALRELYEGGQISAAEYNQELKNTSDKQRELKGAVEQTASAGQQAGEQLTRSQQMYNQALEDGILTNEELRRTSGQRMEDERRASGELMEQQRKGMVVAERDMSAMEDFFGGVMTRAREPLAAMSDAALEAFDRLSGISTVNLEMDTSSLETTTEALNRATEALGEMQAMAGTATLTGFGKWMATTQLQSQQIQVQFLGQKASLQRLMEGYESGSLSVAEFAAQARAARNNLGLLNDSDLRTLESAIAGADQRMQALGDSTRNTLEGLLSELDQLQGREDAVDDRRFAQRRRDLQAQRAEAQAAGNGQAAADLTRALSVLGEIEAETAQKRFAEQVKQQQATAKPAAAQPAQQPATVIRLETARGQKVDVSVPDGQQTQLLDILNEAGLRTL